MKLLPAVDVSDIPVLTVAVGTGSLWLCALAIVAHILVRASHWWAPMFPDILKHRQATKQVIEREKTKRLAIEHETERRRIDTELLLALKAKGKTISCQSAL